MALGRISVPAAAKRGELIDVKVLIQHPMETGFRFDVNGSPIAKNVINSLVCRYNGEEVFRAELGSGVAANPYLQFHAVAEASGMFEVEWVDDTGERGKESARIAVS
jgi:sulfur-oxidizing protein SoxZ